MKPEFNKSDRMWSACGDLDCRRPELEQTITSLEEDRVYWRDQANNAYARADIFRKRLDRVVTECRNSISGATEDTSRDTLLSWIIVIAEGLPTPAAAGVSDGREG